MYTLYPHPAGGGRGTSGKVAFSFCTVRGRLSLLSFRCIFIPRPSERGLGLFVFFNLSRWKRKAPLQGASCSQGPLRKILVFSFSSNLSSWKRKVTLQGTSCCSCCFLAVS